MIQVNELRIGNYGIYKPTKQNVAIRFIKEDAWAFETTWEYNSDQQDEINEIEWLNLDALDPIPLTPEILESAGFKKNIKRGTHVVEFKNSNDCRIVLFIATDSEMKGKPFMYWGMQDVSFDSVIVEKIQYLHQLQNLYFALTNSELEIKNIVEV